MVSLKRKKEAHTLPELTFLEDTHGALHESKSTYIGIMLKIKNLDLLLIPTKHYKYLVLMPTYT